MGMDDAEIRLILDLAQSSRDAREFTDRIGALKLAGEKAGEGLDAVARAERDIAESRARVAPILAKSIQSYEVLAVAGEGYALAEDHVNEAMDRAVDAAVRATQARQALNAVLADSTVAAGAAGKAAAATEKATGGLGRGMLQTSYAVQDFTAVLSGGGGLSRALGSVQNNIPEILTGLGVGMGMAGVVSVVTVGVGLLIDNWGRLSELFKASKFVVPSLGADMEGLSKSLKQINDAIAETEDLAAKDDKNAFFYTKRLEKLRAAKAEADEQIKNKRAVEGVTYDDSDQARQNAGVARRALANAGGGKRAADAVMDRFGFDRPTAEKTVADALRGDRGGIATLRRSFGDFDKEWEKHAPVYEEARKKAGDAIKGAGDWLVKQVGDLRKSNIAAERDAEKQSREDERAAAKAQTEADRQAKADQAAAAKAAELNQLRGLANNIDQMTGGNLSVGDLEAAARAAAADMKRNNLSAEAAAMRAIQQVVQNQAAIAQDLARIQANWGQIQAGAQTVGTRLNRAR